MISEPQNLEVFARAEVDAATKDLRDCKERADIALDAYMDAMMAFVKAEARERSACRAWFDAKTAAAEGGQAYNAPNFKALLVSNRHLHQLLGELLAAARDVLIIYERGGYGEKTSNHMAHLRAAIAKAEEIAP